MNGFTEMPDLTTAFVDLITGVVLVPFLIYIREMRKQNRAKTLWLWVLGLLSVDNIGGFIAHAPKWNELSFDIVWIFLYAVMYLLLRWFVILSYYELKGEEPKRSLLIPLDVLTAAVCVTNIVLGFVIESSIVVFVIYAAVTCLPGFAVFGFIALKRKRTGCGMMFLAVPFQIFGLVFELMQKGSFEVFGILFNHDGIYHMMLLISAVIFAIAAIKDIKEQ